MTGIHTHMYALTCTSGCAFTGFCAVISRVCGGCGLNLKTTNEVSKAQ